MSDPNSAIPLVSEPQQPQPQRPASAAPSQLQVMAGDFTTIKDRFEREWTLRGLTMRDFAEYERRVREQGLGASVTEINMYALWVAARHKGKSAEDVRRGNYAISFSEFMEAFDLSFVEKAPKLVNDLMIFSGWNPEREETTGKDKDHKDAGGKDKPAGGL